MVKLKRSKSDLVKVVLAHLGRNVAHVYKISERKVALVCLRWVLESDVLVNCGTEPLDVIRDDAVGLDVISLIWCGVDCPALRLYRLRVDSP